MTITAAADGSSLGNPGPTGWAWYIDDDRWAAGGFANGTNNIGELTAVAELLDATAHVDEPLHVLCDSRYVIDSCTKWMRGWKYNGWKKKDGKPVQNVELMQRIDAALKGRRVTFQWVKGHSGHPENEAADERAHAAATAYQLRREPLAGPGFGGGDVDAPHASGGSDADGVRAPAAGMVATARGGAGGDGAPAATDVDAGGRAEAIADADDDAAELDVRGDGTVRPWDDEPAGPTGPTDGELVARLERERLEAAARGNAARLDELLHDDFESIDATGRLVGRADLIAAATAGARTGGVTAGSSEGSVPKVRARTLAAGVQLVQFEAEASPGTGVDGSRVRGTTTWVFEATGPLEGQWRAAFEQLTPLA
ncbi:ribonuclease H [Pseudoclavibacter endophyticus]|uniref:Ribonuclease H n=1 Tax=Pseudoclavibacter endophyticus TaxID=1778590 RepID=A0A6H9WKC5_9MICO|nr:ribonuclease HI family protein [Pseudoclavibacter endophyticus]KAB1648199.1 ribonuclease HI family protein [Pseudoclavibacter endophyticus]GGA70569.1 ribonuclease H [Pseudoclavibacter endophyticus]